MLIISPAEAICNHRASEGRLIKLLSKRFSLPFGLTFFKNYQNTEILGADFTMGSPTATFTATRAADAPATYVDASGVIQLVTTSNIPRFQGGYYDATGFHAQRGLMIEGAGTNLIQDSYFADGTTTYWRVIATATVTNDATYANPYLGGKCQKVVCAAQYDGVQTAVAKKPSVTAGVIYTVSALVKGTGVIRTYFHDGSAQYGSTVTLDPNNWIRITTAFTAANTAASSIGVFGNNNATTFWVAYIQAEAGPYATSFIPTTTAALTRGAEVLKYATSGNRSDVETMIVKLSVEWTGDVGGDRIISDSDTKRRLFGATYSGGGKPYIYPNLTDSGGNAAIGATELTANTSVVEAFTCNHAISPYIVLYKNGVSDATHTSDWTAIAYGTYWYSGSNNTPNSQLDGVIQSVAIFNRALSSSEVASVSNKL